VLGSFQTKIFNQQKNVTGSMGKKIEQVLSTNQVLCLHKLLPTIRNLKVRNLMVPFSCPPSKNDGSFVRQRELGMQLVNQD